MASESDKLDPSILGDSPWAAHGCLFYDTREDLLKVLAAFFRQGLAEHQLCLWVTSPPLTEQEAADHLRRSIPDFDRVSAEGAIEIVPYTNWYLEAGDFDPYRMSRRLKENVDRALAAGYVGLRTSGDASWAAPSARKHVHRYEQHLKRSSESLPVTILCTYPLSSSDADALLDAANIHERAVVARRGKIELIEAPGPMRAKEQIEVRRQREMLQQTFDHCPVMISVARADGRVRWVNRAWSSTLGWTQEEVSREDFDVLAACYPDPASRQNVLEFIAASEERWTDFKTRTKDGRVLDTMWARVRLSDGGSIGFGQDVTDRKHVEELLHANNERLRALSASIQAAREEERTHVARTVHDELGSVLTSLKWDLEGLLENPGDEASQTAVLQRKISGVKQLADRTLETVRRLASELRPSILDDLGLPEAIQWQAKEFETRTGIECRFSDHAGDAVFDAEQSTGLFRILQEALTNVLRHAQATRVEITMERRPFELVMTVRDNGRGIHPIEKSGLGILGMQERARLLGGTLEIQDSDGAGTLVCIRIPQR